MLVKLDVPLTTYDGEALMDNDGKGNAIEATLRLAMINALINPVRDELGPEKFKKDELARRIYKSDEIELSAEEISLIKKRIGEVFPTIVVGQCWRMLEGQEV